MSSQIIDVSRAKFTELRKSGNRLVAPGAKLAIAFPALVYDQPDAEDTWSFTLAQPAENGYVAVEIVLGFVRNGSRGSAADAVLRGGMTKGAADAKRYEILQGIHRDVTLVLDCRTEEEALQHLVRHFGCGRARELLKEPAKN